MDLERKEGGREGGRRQREGERESRVCHYCDEAYNVHVLLTKCDGSIECFDGKHKSKAAQSSNGSCSENHM